MKRPGRKAAEEGQRKVRKLLEMDPEADDSYMALSEPVEAADSDHDEHCSTKAKRPIRSRPKKSRVEDGPSNASIGIVPVVLVSETEDSDFLPDEQPIGDEYIDVSDDYEASKTMKKPSRNTNSIDKSSKRKADKAKKKQLKEDDKIELNWEKWEKELDEWKPWGNDGEIDLDALVQNKGPVDVKEPPPELLMPLLPFQKEWLAWSLKQEESEFNGGFGELHLFEHQIAGPGKSVHMVSVLLLLLLLLLLLSSGSVSERAFIPCHLRCSDGGSSPLKPWFLPSNSNSLQIATGFQFMGFSHGQRAVFKFSQYIGAHAISGRHTPGTLTNQMQTSFNQHRLLILTDPRTDHQGYSSSI